MISENLKNWKLPFSKEEALKRLNDPNRVRYQYWVSDESLPSKGYYKVIKDPSQAPEGIIANQIICMG